MAMGLRVAIWIWSQGCVGVGVACLVRPPRLCPRTRAALVPSPRRFRGGVDWRAPVECRRPHDAGAAAAVGEWWGALEALVASRAPLAEFGAVRVFDVAAAAEDPLGGSWRLLCAGGGGGVVVQSVSRVVEGQVHCGCLVGYTRGLGAACLALGGSSALSLGLGGGSVSSFLAAHGYSRVAAVDVDEDVVAACEATTRGPDNVRVVVADAAEFVRGEARGAFDVVVVDVFDGAGEMPPGLCAPAFAADLARVATRGLALNVVRVSALGRRDANSATLAALVVAAVAERGGTSFLAPDAATENAVLLCDLARASATPEAAAAAAARRRGAPPDVPRALRGAAVVTPETLGAALASLG